jgi:hypothetical protein
MLELELQLVGTTVLHGKEYIRSNETHQGLTSSKT